MKHVLIGLVAVALSLAAPVVRADGLTEAEVKRLALEAILENPEIVMQAVEILRQRDEQAQAAAITNVLQENRALLERDPNAPVIGNPEGDVTIVEFFDYNCPYCKRAAPVVKDAIQADSGLRVVYREWPILGEGSVFAARAALAARNQGRYEEFHWALMELKGRAEEPSVMRLVRQLGLDEERLRADMNSAEVDAHIEASMAMANQLGFNGTPSFVIGDALAPGLIPAEELQRMVDDVRAAK